MSTRFCPEVSKYARFQCQFCKITISVTSKQLIKNMFNVIQGIVIRMSNILCACFNPKPLILESHIQQKYMKPKPQYQNSSSFKSFLAYKAVF